MDEKNLVIIGIIILSLACFGVVVFLGTGAEAIVVGYVIDAFKYAIVSLGSLATGMAIKKPKPTNVIKE